MHVVADWQEDSSSLPEEVSTPHRAAAPRAERCALSPALAAAVWRGHQLGAAHAKTVPTGHAALDRELPGGGWPRRALTEVLQAQAGVFEWRLLGPGLRAAGGTALLLIAPPQQPHAGALQRAGLAGRQLYWIDARSAAERLWATEQAIKSRPDGAVLAWLPQARPDQLRRLQLHAQHCDAPVFLLRPAASRGESSPTPLRVWVTPGSDWSLQLQLVKRRGPVHEGLITLPAPPAGLAGVLASRQPRARPALLSNGDEHVLAGLAGARPEHRRVAAVAH